MLKVPAHPRVWVLFKQKVHKSMPIYGSCMLRLANIDFDMYLPSQQFLHVLASISDKQHFTVSRGRKNGMVTIDKISLRNLILVTVTSETV